LRDLDGTDADDQDAWDAHLASDHLAGFQRANAGVAVAGMELDTYTISDVGPVR